MENDIAVIGYAFDFPSGMDSKEKYWDMLKNGKDIVREIPIERWDWKKIYDSDPNAEGKSYAYHGAFVNDIDKFDANAFRIMPLEAKSIDPQQRLALKTAWRAMENSYLNIEQLKHSDTGVFIGATMDDYLQLQTRLDSGKNIDRYTHFGAVLNDISGRVSYVYGFQGPSMTIDTACSSSMSAIDVAIKALKEDDCKIALAGGVNVILTEEMYIKFSRTQMLSKTGACKTFDDSADGYVRGEGCGILVLEKLKDAQAANRHILAVIRGCSVNHNGNSGGLTVPSGKSQVSLIKKCMKKAGVNPSEIDYVEAHGTGTQLGDKIEVNALQEVFKERETPVLVGSVKTNMGHLESAAGVAGVIKILLCMENNELVPSIHIKEKNKKIKWENSPVEVIEKNVPWKSAVKIAGVSAFGASGTNGHLILEKYEQQEEPDYEEKNKKIYLVVSAKSKLSLQKLMESLYAFFKEKEESEIRKICKVYNVVRSDYSIREVIIGNDKAEFLENFEKSIQDSGKEEQPLEEFCFHLSSGEQQEKLRQLETENVTYQRLVQEIEEVILNEVIREEKKSMIYGIAFCKLVAMIGYKTYSIAGDETVKFQVMLASKNDADYDMLITHYLQKEPSVFAELENYQCKNFINVVKQAEIPENIQDLLLQNAAFQYKAGAKIKWEYLYEINQRNVSYLPGYEFDEKYYWIEHQRHAIDDLKKKTLLGAYLIDLSEAHSEKEYAYIFRLRKATELVEQHRIYQREVLVGTFQVQLIQEVIRSTYGKGYIINELFFLQKIEPELNSLLKIVLEKDSMEHEGSILEQDADGTWIRKTVFTIDMEESSIPQVQDESEEQFTGTFVERTDFYDILLSAGLSLGEQYRIMDVIAQGENTAIALVSKADCDAIVLDSASQLLYLFREQKNDLYIPYYFLSFEQWNALDNVDRVEAKVLEKTAEELVAELTYYAGKQMVARYNQYHLKRVAKEEVFSWEHIIGKRNVLPDKTEMYQKVVFVTGTSLHDHMVYHRLTIPGAYFISQVFGLAEYKLNQEQFELSNINFYHAMVLEENMHINEIMQVKQNKSGYDINICSAISSKEEYLENVKMHMAKRNGIEIPIFVDELEYKSIPAKHLDYNEIIKIQWKIGLNLSDTFHWMQEAWVREDGILAELSNESIETLIGVYGTPPGLVDTAVQILGLLKNVQQEEIGAYIPLTIDRIIHYQKGKKRMYCSVHNIRDKDTLLIADILYYDPENKEKILEFQGMTLIKADINKFGHVAQKEHFIWEEKWTKYQIMEDDGNQLYQNAIEVRLGIHTEKVIFTKYKVADTGHKIIEKQVMDWYDEEWCQLLLGEVGKQQKGLIILTDSSADIQALKMNVTDVYEMSRLVAVFYLKVLKLLQEVDLSNHALCVYTNQVYALQGNKENIIGSTVWGLIRSIQLELKDMKLLLMDCEKQWYQFINVMEECLDNRINQVTVYNEVKVFDITKSMFSVQEQPYQFKEEKSYVVIGGFGALGLATCKHMIQAGVKRLIVIGRSPFVEKKESQQALFAEKKDLDFSYYQIDMAKADAEQRLKEVFKQESNIGGIIYAAGVVKDKMFANYSDEDIQSVYEAKIMGILTLAHVVETLEFDFCACFSSIVGVMGAAGQSVYGAANRFIDTLCSVMQQNGKNMFAIQWGPWANIGMFSKVSKLGAQRYKERNIYVIQENEALDDFFLTLGQGKNLMIVNQQGNKATKTTKIVRTIQKEQKEVRKQDPIMQIIAQSIGLEDESQLNEERSFVDLGIDSLLMLEIRMKVNKTFQVNISLDEFFDNMNIVKLREKIKRLSKDNNRKD